MTKTAYVSGSTGFVGLNLVEELARRGWRVLALHRPGAQTRYLERLNAERLEGDINDPGSLARTLPRNVDAVFHVAGSTNLWSKKNAEQTRINVEGTRNMVEAALAAGAGRFVHTSSISAWGLQTGRIDERAPQLGRASWINYQRSKALAEAEVRKGIAKGLDAVFVNPGAIMGARDRHNWARMILLVHEGTLPGVPPGAASFCHVREVARAHIAAAERGRRGENYLLGGTDASFLELARIVGEVTGKPVPAKATPRWLLRMAAAFESLKSAVSGNAPALTPETVAMVAYARQCDSSKAMRELGYRAVPLRQMVEESYAWLRQEGLIA